MEWCSRPRYGVSWHPTSHTHTRPVQVKLDGDQGRADARSGALWSQLIKYYRGGHLLGAGSNSGSDTVRSCVCVWAGGGGGGGGGCFCGGGPAPTPRMVA